MKRLLVIGGAVVSVLALTGLSNPVGGIRTFTVTCLTTATAITDGKGVSAFRAFNNTATPAFVGGTDVTSTTKGFPLCTDTATCPSSTLPVDGGGAYCLSTGGAVTLLVIAGK